MHFGFTLTLASDHTTTGEVKVIRRYSAGFSFINRSFIGALVSQLSAYHIETARNELIKLSVFEIKCKAMMGICIYWISRHVIFGKRCKTVP